MEKTMIKRLRTLIVLAALAPVAAATPLWANATYTFTSFEGGGNNTGRTTVDGINNNNRSSDSAPT
jgi:hypothetical protein